MLPLSGGKKPKRLLHIKPRRRLEKLLTWQEIVQEQDDLNDEHSLGELFAAEDPGANSRSQMLCEGCGKLDAFEDSEGLGHQITPGADILCTACEAENSKTGLTISEYHLRG